MASCHGDSGTTRSGRARRNAAPIPWHQDPINLDDVRPPSAPTETALEFMERLDQRSPSSCSPTRPDDRSPPVIRWSPEQRTRCRGDRPLPNGTCTVAYRVVSTNGHPGQGSYPFTVADPNSTVPPVASPPTDTPPAAATVKDDRGPGVGVLLVAGSTLTVLVVLVGGLRRRAARRWPDPRSRDRGTFSEGIPERVAGRVPPCLGVGLGTPG
ncbi:copper resistance protein CopC [Micromonospora sp. NBC_00421]|uniref:copper resistance protein CopC n=1 Tax=Micromonospora sp. NBC_00421 TaxID=2975976 RepID=UPI003FA5E539